jgi:hypothetical protein
VFIGAASCTYYDVQVRMRDHNGQTSLSDATSVTTLCSGQAEAECPNNLLEDPGSSARRAVDDLVDWPLALSLPTPNPISGSGIFSYSIPRAMGSVPFAMHLYDVAGRKVVTVAEGAAKAGNHVIELPFVARSGSALRNGVYFLRFEIGNEVLRRTVVLAR